MPPPFETLPAGLRDMTALRKLEKICFPQDAWPLLDIIGALTLPNVIRLKLVDDRGEMIGFIAGEIKSVTRTGWIATVCVHPDCQRQGLGARLLHQCEEAMGMPRVRLTVRESNQAARALYQNNGYYLVGRWEKYYKGGEDGIVLEKVL